ncbi:hypothetical protein BD289DRAFT_124779 [Coniella lustricola]|uniref:Uncharacterized protein n=1 Tax=Coniella lustricola TaxID=2025994 RepID=A0A2T3AG01_9PEZI|nr:hypothetical protein BD289DRAFT_124779 [Coniella lustricola]
MKEAFSPIRAAVNEKSKISAKDKHKQTCDHSQATGDLFKRGYLEDCDSLAGKFSVRRNQEFVVAAQRAMKPKSTKMPSWLSTTNEPRRSSQLRTKDSTGSNKSSEKFRQSHYRISSGARLANRVEIISAPEVHRCTKAQSHRGTLGAPCQQKG